MVIPSLKAKWLRTIKKVSNAALLYTARTVNAMHKQKEKLY